MGKTKQISVIELRKRMLAECRRLSRDLRYTLDVDLSSSSVREIDQNFFERSFYRDKIEGILCAMHVSELITSKDMEHLEKMLIAYE